MLTGSSAGLPQISAAVREVSCENVVACGLTDAATAGCQSNCVLNPSPPAGGSSTPILKNKVIGYYESWSARHACHKVAPVNLPLDALTQYAFLPLV